MLRERSFFFLLPATTDIYTLSLHDALPILATPTTRIRGPPAAATAWAPNRNPARSEEHTSELQSHHDLVCRLLLEKKKTKTQYKSHTLNTPGGRRARYKDLQPIPHLMLSLA